MHKTLFVFLISILCCRETTRSQVFIESGPVGTARDASLIVYGMDGTNRRIPYEKIKGSPFWSADWKDGQLTGADNKDKGTHKVKLNLVTHEIHFLDKKGMELAADDASVREVVFTEAVPEGTQRRVFRNDFGPVNIFYGNNKKYAEILNQGSFQLLKVWIREVKQADSLFGTQKRYYFADRFDYFINHNGKIDKIKKLNREEVMVYLPQGARMDEWIRSKRIRFNREEDLIRLITYYNENIDSQK